MIVIGADTHKRTHCCAGVRMHTGELVEVHEAPARSAGFGELLRWACDLGSQRTWAIEDCRHVSGAFERFLIDAGEQVVRITPKLAAANRQTERSPGKSDPIDALAIARAAVREGIETLPRAYMDERARQIKLLMDHRDALVQARTSNQNRLRWLLHDRWADLEIPAGGLDRDRWLNRLSRRLARHEQFVDIVIARELVGDIRTATRRVRAIETELATRVADAAPALMEIPGCGVLGAARIVAETAGAHDIGSDAKLARLAGAAPVPASSGARHRHRLDRGGNRKLNATIHRIAVVQGRHDPNARAYLAKKQAEGKTRREAIRCLKRFIARRVWQALRASGRCVGGQAQEAAKRELALT